MKPKILFGTNNQHKLEEIRKILANHYEVLCLKDVGEVIDVAETESTLEGNALLKAKSFYEHTGIPCFSDDTGLEVVALGGAPGVYSARYAGEHCSYQDNVNKMLREMEGKDDRRAAFRTLIAWYDGKNENLFEGKISGNITHEPKGNAGFGYDPIFLPEHYEQTFAEMPSELKNSISHRARAVKKFADFILKSHN